MTKEIFKKKLKKASLLSGFLVDIEAADALYDELKSENDRDMLSALKDVAYSSEKINIGNIMKHLCRHKSMRLEEEAIKFKEHEKAEVSAFIANREIPKEVREFLQGLWKETRA